MFRCDMAPGLDKPDFFFSNFFWGWPSFWHGLKTHISRGCPNFSPDPLNGLKTLSTRVGPFPLGHWALKLLVLLRYSIDAIFLH
jgi:hypothetical protein